MVNWSCCSAFCFNNHRTKTPTGEGVKYYKLPKDIALQNEYKRILKTDGINFSSGYICCEHWSTGERQNTSVLPDVVVPKSQLEILRSKVEKLQNRLSKMATPSENDRNNLKNLQRKLEVASSLTTPIFVRKRPSERTASFPPKKPRKPSKRILFSKLKKEQNDLGITKKKLQEANLLIEKLKKENKSLNVMVNNLKRSHKILSQKNKEMHSKQFVYESIKARPKMFKYLCGLSIDQFELLWRCVLPYINLIEYPDCKGTGARALDKVTELFLLLTICRHGLHLGVAGFMVGLAESTIHRIYTGWIVFLSTLFNEINLSPTSHYLAQKNARYFYQNWTWFN